MKPGDNLSPAKLLLCFLMWLVSLQGAQAQGTIYFSNASASLSSPPDRLVRFDPVTVGASPQYNPFGTNNAPVVSFGGSSYEAQLYYGSSTAAEASLVPLTTAPRLFGASTTTVVEPGTWAPGVRTLDGFLPGDTLNLAVRVWDGTYASSWEEYLLVQKGLAGKSPIFSYFIQTDSVGPNPFTMKNFQAFFIGIPEPQALALFCLGYILLASVPKERNQ